LKPDPLWEGPRWINLASNLAAEDLKRPPVTQSVELPPIEPSSDPGSLWVRRGWLIVRVLFWWVLGLLLVSLPWSHVWNENNLLWRLPTMQPILVSRFARGACTGLGLIDMWVGIWEAVRYQEPKSR
jgi:hypothetical protein